MWRIPLSIYLYYGNNLYVYPKIIDSHREQVTLLENEQIIQDNNRLYHTAISISFSLPMILDCFIA